MAEYVSRPPKGGATGGQVGNANVPFKVEEVKGKNLFDKKAIIKEHFLGNNGSPVPMPLYWTIAKPLSIEPNTTLTLKDIRTYYFHDSKGATLLFKNEGINTGVATVTSPNVPTTLIFAGHNSSLDTAMVQYGSEFTGYEEYGKKRFKLNDLVLSEEQINSLKSDQNVGDIVLKKSGENFHLSSKLPDGAPIRIETVRNGSRNNTFNFVKTFVNEKQIHVSGDDITPIRTFSTVGANHGYTCIIRLTMAGHGKQRVDLGSKWTDGKTEYTLLQISGDNLTFGCPYTETDGVVSAMRPVPVANLTHVSGATNKGNITISTIIAGEQLYPSVNDISVKYLLDGKEITEDGSYYGNEVKVIEGYTLMDYKDIMDTAQKNIGTPYSDKPIKGVVRLSNVFTFRKGLNCTTAHSLTALKPVSLQACGFLQSVTLTLSGHTVKRFMPNVKTKEGFDFQNGVDLSNYNLSLNYLKSDLVNENVPPSYYVDWLYDSTGKRTYGFTMGYIVDKSNSKNADRLSNTNTFWDMRSTKKSYPVAIAGKTLKAGDYYSFMGFRNYLSDKEVGGASNLTSVQDEKDLYVYVHSHQPLSAFKKDLNGHIGKVPEIVQGTDITLRSDSIGSEGIVLNTSGTNSHAVIKVR